MALTPGTRLGVYEVVAQIGEGGMGEVYKATDTNLKRSIAIKVLPASVAADADRLARFQREAEVLAALNHPNIAAIYGLERSGATTALVMELVEGPTLADRIAQGAIPLDEALPIAKQIAEALEAAHEQGIIHRDLKPANIKVRSDGTVKVLDFGLAKAMEPAVGSSPSLSMSPTITTPAMTTGVGVLLGTAAYMSPEQARGKTVDKRADIWAFGAVLYELLTGKGPFAGDDVSDTLANVLKREPDWSALPRDASPALRALLRRCLEKDRHRRIRDVAAVLFAIDEEADLTLATPSDTTAHGRGNGRLAWTLAVLLGLGLIGVLALTYFRSAPADAQTTRFFVAPPDGWSVSNSVTPTGGSRAPLAISPDGRRLAFVAAPPEGKDQLWVRSLDTLSAHGLAGTEGAASPFWSPDSRFLAFFADGKLKKIDVAGGPSVTICDSLDNRGGTWGRDGVIVFAPSSAAGLQKVSAAGGVPTAATTLTSGELRHLRPSFLPDGRHFLYNANKAPTPGQLYVGSLDSGERTLVLEKVDSTNVGFAQGHLLYLRETTLMAQPFDPQRLTVSGEAVPIAEEIRTQANLVVGNFSVSDNGALAYQTGAAGGVGTELLWVDRTGKTISALGDRAVYSDLTLSPDGRRAAVAVLDVASGNRDIWLFDIARGVRTRFTFDSANERRPVWSPDATRVIFDSIRKGTYDLYQKSATGHGSEETILQTEREDFPYSWSPDGRSLLYRSAGQSGDLWLLPLTGDRKPSPFLQTPFDKTTPQFSPDGRWVAYVSNESGRDEVYVTPFPKPDGKWQISTEGGVYPRWRRDGQELFYSAPGGRLIGVAVSGKGAGIDVGVAKVLFQNDVTLGYPYDVSADGQRFLIISNRSGQAGSEPLVVVLNWAAGLKR